MRKNNVLLVDIQNVGKRPLTIDVLFRRNDEGRIYGATFIDHTTRTVLNGSRLGNDYSANVFNDLYSEKTRTGTRAS